MDPPPAGGSSASRPRLLRFRFLLVGQCRPSPRASPRHPRRGGRALGGVAGGSGLAEDGTVREPPLRKIVGLGAHPEAAVFVQAGLRPTREREPWIRLVGQQGGFCDMAHQQDPGTSTVPGTRPRRSDVAARRRMKIVAIVYTGRSLLGRPFMSVVSAVSDKHAISRGRLLRLPDLQEVLRLVRRARSREVPGLLGQPEVDLIMSESVGRCVGACGCMGVRSGFVKTCNAGGLAQDDGGKDREKLPRNPREVGRGKSCSGSGDSAKGRRNLAELGQMLAKICKHKRPKWAELGRSLARWWSTSDKHWPISGDAGQNQSKIGDVGQ